MMPWPPALTHRIIEPELLGQASPEDAVANLRDLRRLNRYFGGRRTLHSVLDPLLRPGMRILDVGAASGDHAAAFAQANVVSIDISATHLRTAAGDRVVADAFALPFAPGSFDIVMANLFLHHFEDAAIVALLAEFGRLARVAVVVNDLERSRLAWSFLPLTAPLLRWHPMTIHDGTVSVAAAFQPAELSRLFDFAGMPGARVRRHRPWFRLSAVWRPSGA
jgi:2-polyprenyl-3-methyl-5-hydroxy-6-metoxy-1,4-benzoquinol methylase